MTQVEVAAEISPRASELVWLHAYIGLNWAVGGPSCSVHTDSLYRRGRNKKISPQKSATFHRKSNNREPLHAALMCKKNKSTSFVCGHIPNHWKWLCTWPARMCVCFPFFLAASAIRLPLEVSWRRQSDHLIPTSSPSYTPLPSISVTQAGRRASGGPDGVCYTRFAHRVTVIFICHGSCSGPPHPRGPHRT